MIDYRAYPILFVDDEPQNLVAFRYALDDQFTILTADSGLVALELLERQEVALLVSDQRMPHMDGIELCKRAQELKPETIRIIVTAYADLHAAIDAINRGQVSRYLTKPWRNDELAAVLRTGIEIIHLQRTLRDMEMRLLRGGQSATAYAVQEELAHELSNPVSALALNGEAVLDLIRAAAEAATADQPMLGSLLSNAQETQKDVLAGIEQLRAFIGRLRHGKQTSAIAQGATCDAARVVDSTIRILRAELERSAQVEVAIHATPIVPMDASALGQVLLNLLINAAHAIDKAEPPRRHIQVTISSTTRQAQIRVQDTGCGIAADQQQRIFDPYVTTKPESSGLGLAIVRELVTQVGGEVLVESRQGEGATFIVRLPAVEQPL